MQATPESLPRLRFFVFLLVSVLTGTVQSSPTQTISLRIDNQSGNPLRCSLVYAHFVSSSTPVFTDAITLEFRRHMNSGAISESITGRNMMLENILCGMDIAWQDTATEISLLPLRRATSSHFVVRCAVSDALLCPLSGNF